MANDENCPKNRTSTGRNEVTKRKVTSTYKYLLILLAHIAIQSSQLLRSTLTLSPSTPSSQTESLYPQLLVTGRVRRGVFYP